MRDEYFACKRLAFIDSDPMYTQGSVPGYLNGTAAQDERDRVDMLRRHDVFFTFAENLGGADCRIPLGVFDWRPTRQPIVLSCFEPHRMPGRVAPPHHDDGRLLGADRARTHVRRRLVHGQEHRVSSLPGSPVARLAAAGAGDEWPGAVRHAARQGLARP
jgi:hypothetical protein